MSLSRAGILDVAMEIIDEHGLEGFTQRVLGDRLGVTPMAVYHWFPTKAAIVDALADEVIADIRVAGGPDEGDPDASILGYVRRARRALLAHPALVSVAVARPLVQTTREDDLLLLFATFRAAGFAEDQIPDVILAMVSVTLGLVLYESERHRYERTQTDYAAKRDELRAALEERDDVPEATVDLVARFSDVDRGEAAFEASIRALYDGLKQRAGIMPG